ncbi:MAG: dimethylargininase [Acidobacteriota bacterium]|nr:MAG: dimethylargininase [Acidobacteriota bacterium]
MKYALTRLPPDTIPCCQLTHIGRLPIDHGLALHQHEEYRRVLSKCNYTVITLPAVNEYPDSAFVEDCALILPEATILLPLGTQSRTEESGLMLEPLNTFFPDVRQIKPPARIEGGDLLTFGKRIFAGRSSRTDRRGIETLSELTSEWGYEVAEVPVRGSLHLKTAVTALDEETVLMNKGWVDPSAFEGIRVIEIDNEEPFAANVLRLGNRIVAHAGFPGTIEKLRDAGFEVMAVDISEFLKAEAGLTCLSLLSP